MPDNYRLIEKIEKLKKCATSAERERLIYEWVKTGVCNFGEFHDLLNFNSFVEILNSDKKENNNGRSLRCNVP